MFPDSTFLVRVPTRPSPAAVAALARDLESAFPDAFIHSMIRRTRLGARGAVVCMPTARVLGYADEPYRDAWGSALHVIGNAPGPVEPFEARDADADTPTHAPVDAESDAESDAECDAECEGEGEGETSDPTVGDRIAWVLPADTPLEGAWLRIETELVWFDLVRTHGARASEPRASRDALVLAGIARRVERAFAAAELWYGPDTDDDASYVRYDARLRTAIARHAAWLAGVARRRRVNRAPRGCATGFV
jgi:hypothetical protein